MSILHPTLMVLAGLAIGIPIVLHLLMRRRPRHRVFPALRFLQKRRITNQRKLQLRHWLLLAMRCAAIAAVGLAMSRAKIASAVAGQWLVAMGAALLFAVVAALAFAVWRQRRSARTVIGLVVASCVLALLTSVLTNRAIKGSGQGVLGGQQSPVAAVMIFDDSIRMQYREQNQSRFDVAKQIGTDLMADLPLDSELAILSTSHPQGNFAVDTSTARSEIEALETSFDHGPLTDAIRSAWDLLQTSDKTSREIYLFSDLTAKSWDNSNESVKSLLDDADRPAMYVIDVGSPSARNFSVQPPRLSADTVTGGNVVHVSVAIHALESSDSRMVELLLEKPNVRLPIIVDGAPRLPKHVRRDQQQITLDTNGSVTVNFDLRGLPIGTHHGQIRLSGEDGLNVDDIAYFTVEVSPSWPVLIAASAGVDTNLMTDFIAPAQASQQGWARFRCDTVSPEELDEVTLENYRCICLLDPSPLPAATWRKLTRYVNQGGGLAVFLGRRAQPANSLNQAEAQALLPGKLLRQWRSGDEDVFLSPTSAAHPILQVFRDLESTIPWTQFPVFRHWVIGDTNPGCNVLFRYSNDHPALLARTVGRGHAITLTTPAFEPNRRSRSPWSELATALDPWPFFVLVNEMFEYLAQSGEGNLNYDIGQTVVLSCLSEDAERFQLFTPDNTWQDVTSQSGELRISLATTPGTYRLKANSGSSPPRGFSLNLDPGSTDLTRVTSQQLDEILGARQYRLARGREKIEREIGEARVGLELYPWLIAMLAMVLALEQFMANRFYQPLGAGLTGRHPATGLASLIGWIRRPATSDKAESTV